MATIPMITPNAFQSIIGRHGNSYVSDSNKVFQCLSVDVLDMLNNGFVFAPDASGAYSNFSATVDPTISNDNTQDYAVGSSWYNTTAKRVWTCLSAATGAAVWNLDSGPQKSGTNLTCGTCTVNGTTPVAVGNTSISAITDIVIFSLNTAGGTVGTPHLSAAPTPNTGFSVVSQASDTSVYNYMIIHSAA